MTSLRGSGADREDVAERLAFVMGTLVRRLRTTHDGLTHPSLSALASVIRAGAVRPGDLARSEGIGAPGATRVLADLEQRGLVVRAADPDDGRSTLFGPTPAGRAAIAAARRERASALALLLADADDDELTSLAHAVQILESALERARGAQALPVSPAGA